MTAKQIISKLLLAFVLVSIGFALGRETALRSARASAPSPDAASPGAQAPDRRAQRTTNAGLRARPSGTASPTGC